MQNQTARAAQSDPSSVGKWEPIHYRFQHLPVHNALLRTGKLLVFGGSGNDRAWLKNPHPAELFDPQSGTITSVEQKLGGDVFCAGHTFLSDGRLLVAGGTHAYDEKRFGTFPFPPFTGIEQSYIFDPKTEAWTRAEDMSIGRWYPTLIMLGDERVIVTAGFTKYFPWVVLRRTEIYTVGQGWSHFAKADHWLPLYPRLHLLPDGNVFYAGSYNTHYTFPFTLSSFPTSLLNPSTGDWVAIGLPNTSQREEGSTVLMALTPPDYKPRVLLMGGGYPTGTEAVPDAEIIDLSAAKPVWRRVAPMNHARYYCYTVLLPNKQILVLGGRGGHKGMKMPSMPPSMPDMPGMDGPPQDPEAVREAEIFDPVTETWTPVASMAVDRLYHSAAVLLPDGRVVVTGNNPMPGLEEHRIEIYDPPYLFNGPRPQIAHAPGEAAYGATLDIETPDADQIDEVVLIHPTSTTHCFSTDQRYVGLAIVTKGSGKVTAQLPTNRNLLPPGYYMLFILSNGIPSIAPFIRVRGS